MEHISGVQLTKYQKILDEINSEFQKHEKLEKDVETETGRIAAIRVAMEKDFLKENVFKVLVKIFSSVFEVQYVYNNDIPKSEFEILQKLTNCKFYLVEIYISALFFQKIINQNWFLNVCVKNNKICSNKTVVINKKNTSGPIRVVIPFDTSTEACVTTILFMNFDKYWSPLKISEISTNISYHFASEGSYTTVPKRSPITKITMNYNTSLNAKLLKIPKLEYNFKCKCTLKHFFESLVKNCYHRLNPQVFSLFATEGSNLITVNFTVESSHETKITLNKQENTLSIVSNVKDLHLIKKYFIEEIKCQKPSTDKMWLLALTNMKHYLQKELLIQNRNPANLKIIYKEFRKLIFELAV